MRSQPRPRWRSVRVNVDALVVVFVVVFVVVVVIDGVVGIVVVVDQQWPTH